MKHIFTMWCVCSVLLVQAQQLSNQSIIGSNSTENDAKILNLPDGSYLLAITSNGGQSGMKSVPSFGLKDCWILRYDANDNLLWQKAYGGDADDFVQNMILSQDNQILVLCSSFSGVSGNKTVELVGGSDAWLFKIADDGNILWQQGFGTTTYDGCKAIIAHPDQSIYLGFTNQISDGSFTDQIYGLGDMMILKLDAQGNKIWDHSYGTTGMDQLEQLQLEPYTNKVVVFGNVSEAGTGNMTPIASVSGTNCWVFKIDPNGDILEQTCFGSGTQYGEIQAVYLQDGSCWVMVGTQSDIEGDQNLVGFGVIDTWLVQLNANLEIIEQRVFGGTAIDTPQNLSSDGQLIELLIMSNSPISGNKTESCRGFADVWYLQLNGIDGEILFQKTIGGTQTEYNATSLRKGADIRFFIETNSPNGADKQVANYNINSDIWCVTMSSTLQINAEANNSVVIFPNPSSGQLQIGVTNTIQNVELIDAHGRLCQKFDLQTGLNLFNFSDLVPGSYFIHTGTSVLNWVVE